jgi:NADPH:quinone reductase
MQIAKQLGAVAVGATSRTRKRADLLLHLGASFTIASEVDDFEGMVREETNGRGVDVIIDHVGGPLLEDSLKSLALGGRLVSVSRLGGTHANVDLDLIARNRLSIVGVTFRTRSREQFAQISQAMHATLKTNLGDRSIGAPIELVVPFDDAPDAYETMANDTVMGKIVIDMLK